MPNAFPSSAGRSEIVLQELSFSAWKLRSLGACPCWRGKREEMLIKGDSVLFIFDFGVGCVAKLTCQLSYRFNRNFADDSGQSQLPQKALTLAAPCREEWHWMVCWCCLSGTSEYFCSASTAYYCLMDFNRSVLKLKPSTSVGIWQVIGLVKQNQ